MENRGTLFSYPSTQRILPFFKATSSNIYEESCTVTNTSCDGEIQLMTTRTWVILPVSDLDANIDFYTNNLGWTLGERPAPDSAYILEPDGKAILLAGPGVDNTTSYLQANTLIKQPGSTLHLHATDTDALRVALEQRGFHHLRTVKSMWQYELYVPAPEHMLVFTAPAPLSMQEILECYEQGPRELDAVLAGHSEADLDLSRAPGEWTIRQIVHHISDGDDLWAMTIKAALAASGASYMHDWYSTDNACFVPLDYAGLSIEPALALFRATRAHITQLLHHLPADAWKRYVMFKGHGMNKPEKVTVAFIVQMQARHALEHIAEIREILSTASRQT
jgi:catechol 2,3-dioxygenase-like lactoylglutathione lyase family enzyme